MTQNLEISYSHNINETPLGRNALKKLKKLHRDENYIAALELLSQHKNFDAAVIKNEIARHLEIIDMIFDNLGHPQALDQLTVNEFLNTSDTIYHIILSYSNTVTSPAKRNKLMDKLDNDLGLKKSINFISAARNLLGQGKKL